MFGISNKVSDESSLLLVVSLGRYQQLIICHPDSDTLVNQLGS